MQNENNQGAPSGFDKEMAEILESFLIESSEIVETMGQDLLELERRPSDRELLNGIFRASHTLKGTSAFLGFTQLSELSHLMEDLLNKLRKGELTATADVIDTMFESFDAVKALLQRIAAREVQTVDLRRVVENLQVCIQSSDTQKIAAPGASPKEQAPVGESQNVNPVVAAEIVESTIRVEVSRLDNLMNLVGELVLARNRLAQSAQSFTEDSSNPGVVNQLQETSVAVDFITTELQLAVMKTRLVPVAKVFNKLPRLVRELSKETQRDIDLQIYGKETELDKSVIDQLNDPLIHIIRNAVDHGIESPDERRKAGKPEKGIIVVHAEREGNHIVVSVEDDGKGMDPEALKKKAIERGLVTEAAAAEMSDHEARNLIFIPGFSTAHAVTNISGRGVGMDIVRTNIAKLKGVIEIDSVLGRGTVFTLKLPLTLAIIQGLIVEAGGESFALPLGAVLEVVRIRKSEVATVNGKKVLRMRSSVLPVAELSRILCRETKERTAEWAYVVVVTWSNQQMGIIVDSLKGQREIVIKSLGEYLGNVPAIAGSTILGDGSIVLIIDIGQFMELCRTSSERLMEYRMQDKDAA